MKQFGCDEQEVRTFAQWLGSPAIVKVVVLRSAVAGADFSRTIDPHIFKSGVYTFNSGNLDEMNDGILSIHTC